MPYMDQASWPRYEFPLNPFGKHLCPIALKCSDSVGSRAFRFCTKAKGHPGGHCSNGDVIHVRVDTLTPVA